jgi:fructose-1,6-bisphosphatase/inositol monophosphatase family enzyme
MTPAAPPPAPRELEAIAVQAALAGASFIRMAHGDLGAVGTKSTPTDPVTSLDIGTEEVIRKVLAERTPNASVIGEEAGAVEGTSGIGWVIDPIDGTVNLTYDLPVMGVSIAATVDAEIVAGAVVDVLRGDTFSASAGEGARLDGDAIRPSAATELSTSLIGTGFMYTPDGRAMEAEYVARVLPAARDIRCMGSAALNVCWVGCGRLDGFYQRNMQYWDFAAGEIIAREAGATISGPDEQNGGLMVVSTPGIHTELHKLVA